MYTRSSSRSGKMYWAYTPRIVATASLCFMGFFAEQSDFVDDFNTSSAPRSAIRVVRTHHDASL